MLFVVLRPLARPRIYVSVLLDLFFSSNSAIDRLAKAFCDSRSKQVKKLMNFMMRLIDPFKLM